MDFNWTAPLQLAGDLFIFVLGCALLILVATVGLAVLIGGLSIIVGLFRFAFGQKTKETPDDSGPKNDPEGDIYEKTLKDYLKSVK